MRIPRSSERNRRGNALIEFSLLGIPVLFITISLVAVSLDMWEFHNLAYATDATARYVSLHGCTGGNAGCKITVGTIATYFEGVAGALDNSQVIMKLTDGGGTTTTCNPVNTCTSSATTFPPSTQNSVGTDVTVSASYVLKNPLVLYWPPDLDPPADFTVGAKSRQRILF